MLSVSLHDEMQIQQTLGSHHEMLQLQIKGAHKQSCTDIRDIQTAGERTCCTRSRRLFEGGMNAATQCNAEKIKRLRCFSLEIELYYPSPLSFIYPV